MKFQQYGNTKDFGDDVLEILLEHEVENNLPISFIYNELNQDTSRWLMATVKDDTGAVLLTAACTPPFNLVLFETRKVPNDAAMKLLSDELKSMNFNIPGILAAQEPATRFAKIHVGESRYRQNISMNVMRLDKVNPIPKPPGHCRVLQADDLFFTPYWERAFAEDCRVDVLDIPEYVERIRTRLGKDLHYIWEDEFPVSQAVFGRSTKSNAVISCVYTPPQYRGKGYASSVVADLSQSLLDRGHKFCCLFADAQNPVSCGIYRKIGYQDLFIFEDLKFEADLY